MNDKFLAIKSFFTVIFAFVGNRLGMICSTMILLILLMIADYISGMLAAKKEAIEHSDDSEYGWSSKKSIIGIYKKVGYILTVLVAVSSDYIIFKVIDEIGITYKTNTMFGLLVIIWLILNELLSILENAGRMGVNLSPFLIKVLSETKNKIEKNNFLVLV